METTLTKQEIDGKIFRLIEALRALGPMHPGSLSQQYHVCGKPGCKCCAAQNPSPHGPYAKLTYVYHGKSHCRFVRAESVSEVTALVEAFKTFRRLTDEWVALAIERARLGPLQPRGRASKSAPRAKNTPKSRRQRK